MSSPKQIRAEGEAHKIVQIIIELTELHGRLPTEEEIRERFMSDQGETNRPELTYETNEGEH